MDFYSAEERFNVMFIVFFAIIVVSFLLICYCNLKSKYPGAFIAPQPTSTVATTSISYNPGHNPQQQITHVRGFTPGYNNQYSSQPPIEPTAPPPSYHAFPPSSFRGIIPQQHNQFYNRHCKKIMLFSYRSLFFFIASLPICYADFEEFIRSNGGYVVFFAPIGIFLAVVARMCYLAYKKKLNLNWLTGHGNRFVEVGGDFQGSRPPQTLQNQQFNMANNPVPPPYSAAPPSGGFSSGFAPPLSGFSNSPYPPPPQR